MTAWLDLDSVRHLCYEFAVNMAWNGSEPIPAFDSRYPGKLEACLAAPQQTFDGKLLYPTIHDQAAILFYLLNKDHPFLNGNKRIALTTWSVFLFINRLWLEVGNLEDLYNFAVYVAASEAKKKDETLRMIKGFSRAYSKQVDLEALIKQLPKP